MGIESFIKEQLTNTESKSLRRWALQFVDMYICKSCEGSRLKTDLDHSKLIIRIFLI